MKALQKDPSARYGSVVELAEDLTRYLDGRPVTARAGTLRYRIGKFGVRHRLALAIGIVVAGSLTATTAMSLVQARRARTSARESDGRTRALLVEQGLHELDRPRASRALTYRQRPDPRPRA